MLNELVILASNPPPGYLVWGPIMINLNTLNLPQLMIGLASGVAAVASWLQSKRVSAKVDVVAENAAVAVGHAQTAVEQVAATATTTQDIHALVIDSKDAADNRIALLEERLLNLTQSAFVKTMALTPPVTPPADPPTESLTVVKDPYHG